MAERLTEASNSTVAWFRDPRTPSRRMRASWHRDARIVVLSLWTDELCTGTFRLRLEDAPDLVHLLVDAMAQAPPAPPEPPVPPRRTRWRGRVAHLFRRTPLAPVITLHDPD